MARGTNQKLKLYYLVQIMLAKTDEEHSLTITFRPTDEEYSVFSVDVNVSPQFFGWIFGLGKEVKVIGPESVVEQMRKAAEEFMENYEI